MKRADIARHGGGGNDEVFKRRVGVRLRNAGEHPKECWAKVLLGFEADAACLCAGNERLDLNVNKPRSFAIAAKNVGVRRVA